MCFTHLVASLPFPGRPRVQGPHQEFDSFPKAMLALPWKVDGGTHWKKELFLFGSLRETGIRGYPWSLTPGIHRGIPGHSL